MRLPRIPCGCGRTIDPLDLREFLRGNVRRSDEYSLHIFPWGVDLFVSCGRCGEWPVDENSHGYSGDTNERISPPMIDAGILIEVFGGRHVLPMARYLTDGTDRKPPRLPTYQCQDCGHVVDPLALREMRYPAGVDIGDDGSEWPHLAGVHNDEYSLYLSHHGARVQVICGTCGFVQCGDDEDEHPIDPEVFLGPFREIVSTGPPTDVESTIDRFGDRGVLQW